MEHFIRQLHLALLKSIFYCLNYLGDLILAALTFTKTGFESAVQIVGFRNIVGTISKNAFQRLATHDIRLMGRKDATSLGDFPAFSNGMIVATQALTNQFCENRWRLKFINYFCKNFHWLCSECVSASFSQEHFIYFYGRKFCRRKVWQNQGMSFCKSLVKLCRTNYCLYQKKY